MEETENVKWCVFKVPQYIFTGIVIDKSHLLFQKDHYDNNNYVEVIICQLFVMASLNGLHNVELIIIYGVKGLHLVATIIKVVVMLQFMKYLFISVLLSLKATCITIATSLSPF